MTLEAQLPLHGTRDFGVEWDDPEMLEYQTCDLCPICHRLINDNFRRDQ